VSSQLEFSLIETYFTDLTSTRDDVNLGIGDDCALLQSPDEHVVAVSIDTLVEGIHFFKDVDPENLGYKSLAVGLSDLAAMGAEPAWFTLALTLPEVDKKWLKGFSQGLANLAEKYNVQLVGGDTTKGPLTISIQVHGFVKVEHALRRDGAQAGDLIYVTGSLGDAGVGLQLKLETWNDECLSTADKQYLIQRLERPTPRVQLAHNLRNFASAAIDISDGLSSDLGHILKKSGVGATIDVTKLPLSSTLQKIDAEQAQNFALNSGDDYELCFIIPADKQAMFESTVTGAYTQIGIIEVESGLKIIDADGQQLTVTGSGYDHFSAKS
jgi:thiamine-monophosphate kinase